MQRKEKQLEVWEELCKVFTEYINSMRVGRVYG